MLLTSGPQLISIIPNDGSLLLANATVHTAPTQLTFRFLLGAGETLDPTTLGGIQLARSGGDGVFNNGNDATVTPGYVGIDPAQPNQVVVRFSSPLPDDLYRITVAGAGANALKDTATPALRFNGGVNVTQDFRLALGPQVLSVVPQPVTRTGAGALQLNDKEIDVYFDKPLQTLQNDPTHLDPGQFQLIATQSSANTIDDVVYHPTTVVYDALNNEAKLTFSANISTLGSGAFRLRIGNTDTPVPPPAAPTPYSGGSTGTFAGAEALGSMGAQTRIFSGTLSTQAIDPNLVFPGGIDDPGHRLIPISGENHAIGLGGASVVTYSFPDIYGSDPTTGQPLHNQITANEKQTVRQIYQLYSYYTGINAYEVPSGGTSIFVGDLRALDPTIPPLAAAGLGGGGGVGINGNFDWGTGLYGTGFMSVAMHEIGHSLGLPHDDDGPPGTIMNGGAETGVPSNGPAPPPIYPGLADITNLQHGYEPNSNQIDLYRFTVDTTGKLSAQTKAQQLAIPSKLNTLLTIYEEFSDLNLPASGAQIVNGHRFTITDDVHPTVTFEFTNNQSLIDGSTGKLANGNFGVFFSAANARQDLAVSVVVAVQNAARVAGLIASATIGTAGVQLAGPITVSAALAPELSVSTERTTIARNDDYYGKDSFIGTDLSPGIYYAAVTSTGNDQFNPNLAASGWGGQTSGGYQLLLNFQPASTQPLTDSGLSLFAPTAGAVAIPNGYSFTLTDVNTTNGQPVTETVVFHNDGLTTPGAINVQLLLTDTQNVVANKIVTAVQAAIVAGGFNSANYILSNIGSGRVEIGGGAATIISVDATGKGALTGTPLVLWGDTHRGALVGNSGAGGAGAYDFWFNVGQTIYVDKTAAAGGSGAIGSPYNTIQAALANSAVTSAAANGQLVDVRVEGNVNATLGIAVSQSGSAKILASQTFRVSAGAFIGTFEFTSDQTKLPGQLLTDGNFAVVLPVSPTAANIALSVQAALNAAWTALPNGGQAALTPTQTAARIAANQLAGQVVAVANGDVSISVTSDANYVYVKLFQGQFPITVLKQTTPFNAQLAGVTVPQLNVNSPYLVGADQFGTLLPDNSPGNSLLQLPKNVVLMVDAGAVFKLNKANIEIGSSAVNIDNSQSALQVLGVPGNQVTFTSYNDDSIATAQTHPGISVKAGDWGGLVFNNDSDLETLGVFMNSVSEAKLNFGGGQVFVNGVPQFYDAIYLGTARPALANNLIVNSASAAISANPNSFESTRFGSDLTIKVTGAPADGQTFTVGGTTFEFDNNGVVAQGRVAVLFAGLTPAQIATAIRKAVNNALYSNSVAQAQAVGNVVTLPTDLTHSASAGALTFATDSFSLEYQRFGPDVHGNLLSQGTLSPVPFYNPNLPGQQVQIGSTYVAATQNTINGLFIRINTNAGQALDTLDVSAELAATDIPYVLQENLVIHDDLGFITSAGAAVQRVAGQLLVDPGVVVKLASARIEAGFGSNVIAEGTAAQPVVFTSLNDARYGGGGTFDTPNNKGLVRPGQGDWGGLFFAPTSSGSLDHVLITFGGGAAAIEGGFDTFDAVEIHQATVRIADSTLENNAGRGGGDRNGRIGSDASTIFVLGAQPALINNIIQNNQGAAISVDVQSLTTELTPDWGRSTTPPGGYSGLNVDLSAVPSGTGGPLVARYGQFDNNYGPLVRLNKIGGNALNGMAVRGSTLEAASIWDDTDVVHVLEGTVTVPNFASVGGLRLQSSATQSLVVKAIPGSGLIASGAPLDISNRIGGEIQILGTPQHPVVLTSYRDDSVGAGLTPTGQPNNDTNNDGLSVGQPGDWGTIDSVNPASPGGGIIFNQFSNDRNVAMINQAQPGSTPATAQSLGQLAPNEQSGDDNSRLGFQVNGFLGPQEIDTYTFKGTAGTQVWLNVTNTSSALDAVLELVDAQGNVLARSDNSGAEQRDASAAGDPLFAGPLLKGETTNNLAQPLQGQTTGTGGRNYWSTNPYDPGFRVVLPGSAGDVNNYYVRVYAKGQSPNPAYTPGKGAAGGQYQLQVRLHEQVEIPGSTVVSADIRYATNGIDVEGLPGHSPLVSNTSTQSTAHNSLPSAQDLGDPITSDTSSVNAGGNLAGSGSVDWYKFELTYTAIQAIVGVNGGPKTWATVFDVGYADGLTRPNTVIDVYDSFGNLIYTGRDSNVADQQPRPNAGLDANELNHSSFGTLDPFIGSVQLPTGTPGSGIFTYYVAIHSNATLPQALDGTLNATSSNYLVRLEPIDSLNRIVEDHIGTQGGQTAQDPTTLTPLWGTQASQTVATLNTYATPYNLSDVVLFGNTAGRNGHLLTFNPFTGAQVTDQGQFNGNDQGGFNDIAMRNDGELFGLSLGTGAPAAASDGNSGNLIRIDTGTPSADVFVQDDGVVTYKPDPASTTGALAGANVGVQYDAFAFNPITSDTALQKTPPDFWAIGHRSGDRPDTGSTIHDPNWPGGYNTFTNLLYHFVWSTSSNTYVPAGFSTSPPVPYTNPRNAGTGIAPAGDPLYPSSRIVTGLIGSGSEAITGLAMIGAGGTMYAVSNEGNLYRLDTASGTFTWIASEGGVAFNGLTGGPTHVENGAYASTLFATDSGGNLYAYNTSGAALAIFVGGATSVALGAGVEGIAFSTLDYNLWHVTAHRGADPATTPADQGHGIVAAPDQSRTLKTPNPPAAGAQSFYFGLENPTAPDARSTQPGAGSYFTNPAIAGGWVENNSTYTASPNYNLPGGAYGSLSTNTFSLANYSAADKPTVYFDYYLNTQDAASTKANLTQMLDSARMLISKDGGVTWQLLATNNPYRATFPDPLEAELPYYQSPNSETGSIDSGLGGLQVVQPLFDSTTTNTGWRQARIDLSDYAGQTTLQFRFDFSTAGTTFNPDDLVINAVTGKANPYANPNVPGNQFGNLTGGQTGAHAGAQRGVNNNHEGWYIDDITIGLAERGEMITNPNALSSGTAPTNYNNLPVNPQPGAVQEVLSGPYQLEIRRGTEFGANFDTFLPDIALYQTFDSNDRLSHSFSMISPAGSGLSDGETFTLSDGVHSVTFEFDNNGSVAPGNAPIAFQANFTAQQVANAIVSAVNGNPTLVNVSAADVNNGAQATPNQPLINIVNFFNVKELSQGTATYNRVTVSLASGSVTESSTNNQGTVTRSGNLSLPLTVTLSALDIDNGLAPSGNAAFVGGLTTIAVTIPANQSFVNFFYNGVLHLLPNLSEEADGTHTVEITASALNYIGVGARVDVTDDPGVYPTFTVSLGANSVVEDGAPVSATVSINTGPVSALQHPGGLTVSLSSLWPDAALVAATALGPAASQTTVTIPVGATQTTFFVFPQDDDVTGRPGGQRNAKIVATATGVVSGNAVLTVTDDSDGTIPYGVPAWASIGPAPISQGQVAGGLPVSGRITGIAADPTDANIVYISAAGGGVWKTTNATAASPTWTPLTDNLTDSGGNRIPLFMGAVAVAPNNHNVIYAGTGEANNSGDSGYGSGILVSIDGGANWTLRNAGGAFSRRTVAKIAVDPTDPNVAYAAVDDFGENGQSGNTGIWKTTDGGVNWTNTTVAFGSAFVEYSDVVVDPQTPSTVYAAIGTYFGDPSNGVYKSTNGGASWNLLNGSGSFNGVQDGRIVLALYHAGATSELFASISSPATAGLFKMLKSVNDGASFTDLTSNVLAVSNYLGGQGWYDTTLAISPQNPNYIYAAGVMSSQGPTFAGSPLESFDGGATWTSIATGADGKGPHTDAHAVAFDANGDLLDGDDGGIFKLSNPTSVALQRWSSLNTNLSTIQFQGIALHPTNPNIVLGGSQDNGTERYNGSTAWNLTDFGDGGTVRFNQQNGNIAYHEYAGGFFSVSNDGGQTWALAMSGLSLSGTKNFYVPFTVAPSNGSEVLLGDNNLWITTNSAGSWAKLTTVGTAGWNPSGSAVDTIAIAPSDTNTIYASTGGAFASTSQIFRSTNGGTSWTGINLPAGSGRVNQLAVDPNNSQIAYAVVNAFTGGGKHVFRTANGGVSWSDISAGLPDFPTNAIAINSNSGALYVGNDTGVYVSNNLGLTWSVLGTGLPNAQVVDLQYNPTFNLLGAATHGRGAFLLPATTGGATLTLSVNGLTQVTDDAGVLAGKLTVTRIGTVGNLVVTLTSSNPAVASVPATVTILNGQSSANITVTIIDGVLAAGPQSALFTATTGGVAGLESVGAVLDVLPDGDPNTPTDNDTPALTLSIPNVTMVPGTPSQVLTATITRNTPTTDPLVVSLASMDPTVASVPATITIPAGQASWTFQITEVDHFVADAERVVSIVAAAAGFSSGAGAVTADSTEHLIRYNLRGDVTTPRPQGEVILYGNQISNVSQSGIFVQGVRSALGGASQPYPGGVANTPTLNAASLAPGVVIANNLIYGAVQRGITFQGTAQIAGQPQGVVPFGRIVNNTIYGGDTPAGVGILVNNSAFPTILNNVLVNLTAGQALVVQGGSSAVLGENYYQNSGASPTTGIALGNFNVVVTAATPSPFRNPSTDPSTANFYLTDTALPIDSSINSLQDRASMTSVTGPLGIPPSPIIAPGFDLYGQLRVDDSDVANANLGTGQNVFIDRGAIEHADTAGPSTALLAPVDNDLNDLDTTRNVVFLRGQSLSEFTLQLSDGSGSGIYDASVIAARVDVREDGQLLTPGVDYFFDYDNNNHILHLVAASGVWLNGHQYDIYLDNGVKFDPGNLAAAPVGITDRAGNKLQANGPDGLTHFRLLLANPTNSTPVVSLVTTGPAALSMYENDNAASPISATFSSSLAFSAADNKAVTLSIFDVDANGGSETLTLTATHGVLTLSNSALAGLTLLGIDTSLIGNGTSAITITAPLGEASVFGSTPGINAALDGLTFTPDLNFDNHLGDLAVITVTINDNGNSPAPAQSALLTIPITVIAVNDPPAEAVPLSPISTDEDYPVVFSAALAGAVTVSDPDVPVASSDYANPLVMFEETITLSNPTLGTLQLASAAGLTFLNGTANGQSSLDFVGTLADVNAALDGLTFIPTPRHSGLVTLQFVTNDQGNIGVGPAPGHLPAPQPLSATATIDVNIVPELYAPTLTAGASLHFAPVAEDTPVASNGGSTVLTMLQSDPSFPSTPITLNAPAFESPQYGIAVIGATQTTHGIWQFKAPSAPGWTAFPAVSSTSALLLGQDDLVRFLPNPKFDDTRGPLPTLSFVAWDGTYDLFSGAPDLDGSIVDLTQTGTGGDTPFSDLGSPAAATLDVTPQPEAPTLASAATLAFTAITEDLPPAVNTGSTVLAMLQSDPLFQPNAITLHATASPQYGIAVVGLGQTANGTWQYELAGGNWVAFPAVSTTSAFLLDRADLVRFLPNPKFDDTRGGAPALSFVAWDETFDYVNNRIDVHGTSVDLTSTLTGGSTPFSSGPAATAALHVVPVAEAPTLASTAALAFSSINEDVPVASNTGGTVLAMLQSDPLFQPNAITLHAVASPKNGIAVVGLGETLHGTWQYELAGGSWTNFPAVSTSSAFLLDGADLVRFLPNPKFDDSRGPAPTLTFVAWDETFDFVNNRIDLHGTAVDLTSTLTGGSTPFSLIGAPATAVLHVVPQPEAPTLNPAAVLAFAPVDEDAAVNPGSPVLAMLQSDPLLQPNAVTLHAAASPQFGIAVVGLGQTASGSWQYELAGGNWTNFPSVSNSSALLLDGADLVRFVPNLNFNDFYGGAPTLTFVAWDETFDYVNQQLDVHGTTVDLTSTLTGGSTPFSTSSVGAKLSVRAVNDAPVVSGPTGPLALNPSFAFSLSTLALPAFTTSDADLPEGNQQMQVTITTTETTDDGAGVVPGGAVALNQLAGITIVGGANHSSSVTIKGNVVAVNAALANLVYEQDMNFNGTAQVTFVANDLGNSGLGGQLDSTPLVLSLTGVPVHRAPVVGAGNPIFPAILENVPPANVPPAGSLISSMLASGGANFLTLDASAGGLPGIAVIGTSPAAGGSWQYSPNGISWTTIANVALNQALLLAGSYQVRFWPDPGFAGPTSLTFAAWDQVAGGAATSTVDLSGANARGGFTSFSTANGVATLNVKLVNQPPIFTLATGDSVLENNTVAASGGSPGGSNAGPIALANFVTGLSPGQPIELQSPFNQAVTFIVTTDRPDLFLTQPTLDPAPAGTTSSSLHFTLKPDVFGTAQITVTAKDNGGTADGGVDTTVATTTLTVLLINDPPSLNALANFNLVESGSPAQQQAPLSGIAAGLGESQVLTVTAVSDNPAAVPNPTIVYTSPNTTGQLTFAPNPYGSGVAHITVTVKDDGGTANGGIDSFSQTFTVNVQYINDAPTFTKGPDVTVNEDDPLTTVPGWATNVSGGRGNADALQTLNFIVLASDPTVFATQPTIDPATGNLKFRFLPNFSGSSNVTVRLHDNGGTAGGGVDTSTIQTFKLTANFVNHAPHFVSGGDQTVNENAPAQMVTNWATGINPGPASNEVGQTLTFTTTNSNPSLFAAGPTINPSTGTLTYTPALNAFGFADVTVTLHDNGGTANGGSDSYSQTFRITVNFVNHAPTFVASGNQTVNENAPLQTVAAWASQISAGPSNESGEALNFIVATDNNSLFSVLPAIDPTTGALTYQPAAYASGVANVTVRLHDDGGTAFGGVDTSPSQTFKITVNFVNQPPSFSLGPNLIVNEDAPAQVVTQFATNVSPGPGANEAGEALNFILTTDNPSLFSAAPTLDPATGTLRYTLASHASGLANVTVQLHDNGGTAFGGLDTSPPQVFTITANFVNHAPTFVLQNGDQVVNMDSGPQSIAGIAVQPSPGPGANEAGQTLNYITTNNNSALFSVQPSIDATGRLTFTPAPQMYGVATVTVVLHDNGGTANGGSDTSAPRTFRILVNAPPVAKDDLFEISFAASSSATAAGGVLSNDTDPNGDTLSAVLVSGTSHGALTLRSDGSFSYAPNPGFEGVDQFTYQATDGHSVSQVVTVGVLGHDDAANIRKLYEQVLHRDPDQAGLLYWTNQIHHGATLADVGESIFESNERLDPILTSYYEQFLLREPEAQGLAYWRDQVWKVVGGPEPVIAGMISSPEFFQSAGGTDSAWVAALYQRLLHRTADAQGLQYWDNLLEQHTLTEYEVVKGFLSSDEYFTNLIDGFFETYLNREPTAAELANDLAQMRAGASQRDIQFEIVDTDEYRNTPPPPPLGTVKRLA